MRTFVRRSKQCDKYAQIRKRERKRGGGQRERGGERKIGGGREREGEDKEREDKRGGGRVREGEEELCRCVHKGRKYGT